MADNWPTDPSAIRTILNDPNYRPQRYSVAFLNRYQDKETNDKIGANLGLERPYIVRPWTSFREKPEKLANYR